MVFIIFIGTFAFEVVECIRRLSGLQLEVWGLYVYSPPYRCMFIKAMCTILPRTPFTSQQFGLFCSDVVQQNRAVLCTIDTVFCDYWPALHSSTESTPMRPKQESPHCHKQSQVICHRRQPNRSMRPESSSFPAPGMHSSFPLSYLMHQSVNQCMNESVSASVITEDSVQPNTFYLSAQALVPVCPDSRYQYSLSVRTLVSFSQSASS